MGRFFLTAKGFFTAKGFLSKAKGFLTAKGVVSKAKGLYLTILASMVFSGELMAMQTYANQINESSWRVRSSVFSCELVHQVPYYGDVVFRTRAGEASASYLRAKTSRFRAGEADIVARSPVWVAQPEEQTLASVGMKRGTRPLWLSSGITERILASLKQGFDIELRGEAWYQQPAPAAKLQVSTIGFQEVYEQYLGCLTSLIPRNFDQLKRTSLLFPGGLVDELPRSAISQLDRILELVKHDAKVRFFYIDGHADSVGDRDENLELSQARAELVAQYLKRRGVPADWITLRWHGERYPVVSNATATGRAKNRRVTVRLERVEEIEVLPLAAN